MTNYRLTFTDRVEPRLAGGTRSSTTSPAQPLGELLALARGLVGDLADQLPAGAVPRPIAGGTRTLTIDRVAVGDVP